MKSSAKSFRGNRALIIVPLTVGICLFGIQLVSAQFFVVDFRFDPSDPGYSPQTPNLLTLTPGQVGATYKIDIYGTATAAAPQATGADFQLQAISLRGLDDGGNAFSTGGGLGVVDGSFIANSPTFLTAGFTQPAVTDLGKTTNNGSTATSGADGLLDFGGTVNPQRLTFFAFPPAPGSGANISTYTWLLGSFEYTIGQANTFSSTTHFWPTLLTSAQGPATAAQFTTTGGAIVAGPVTLSTLPLTFTVAGPPAEVISVTPGAASTSVLKGGSITLSAALNSIGLIDVSGGDYTFTASGGTNVTYGAASPAPETTPIGAGQSQSFNFSATTAPGPAGTPIGIATVTFTAADSGGGKIINSPQTGTMQVNVGGAIADNSNTPVYGAALSAVVGPGSSYAGLESAIVGIQGAGGSNAAVTPFAFPWLGGDAKILAGTKSAAATAPGVSMSWRTRLVKTGTNGLLDETHGGAGSALQTLNTTTGLISNVVNLSGLETGSPSTNNTDPFVFDLTYNTTLLFGHEQALAQNKSIYMVSPSPGPDDGKSQYVNTVLLSTGNVITNPLDPNYGAVSSWNTYALTKFGTTTPTSAQLLSDMGAWGVDTGAHEVWAIVNHNSTFAAAAITALPTTMISVTPGVASASVLKGGTITLSAALNNNGSTDLSGGDYTFTASGGTAIAYGPASPTAATTPIGAGLSQSFTFSASTIPGAAGTPIGIATVSFTAADSGGGKITNSPQSGTMQVNVGGAIGDNSNKPGVYGAALSAVVGPGSSYAGLESAVVGIQGAGGSNAAVTPFASPWLGGDAKILAGTRSAAVTSPGVNMSWRTRLVNTGANGLLDETHGGPGSALQTINATTGLISNVVNLSGLETGSPSANSTGPFVFDLTYNTTLFSGNEQGLAQNKSIYMVSPSPGQDDGKSQYVNTVLLNTGNVITNPLDLNYGAVSSWNTYALTKFGTTTPTATQLSSDMGAWGVDTSSHEVWAIVNHNSTFAAAAITAPPTTMISVTPGVASASVLKGGSITLSAALNNNGSTDLSGGDYTFTASGGTNVTYGAVSPATATTPVGAGLSQSFAFSASTAPGPAGTPIGMATVTFTAADSGGGKIINSPQTGTMQVNVGGAIADNSNKPGVYGMPLSAVVGSGGSYVGLESAVVGIQGAGGSNAAVTPFASPWLGGDAKILAGTKSTAATSPGVSMSWRTRLVNTGSNGLLDETHGGPGSTLQTLNTTTGLISNVVNLSGLEIGSPSTNNTDPFVFDLTYNTASLFGHEQALAQNKSIYVVSPSPGPDDGKSQYVNTVVLNSGNVVTNLLDPNYGAISSWTAYSQAKFGTTTPTATQLSSDMGAWGVDTSTHEVWAIVNHNSTFAAAAITAPPTMISVTPGVASASVLKGGSITLSAALNNTGSTDLNGGDYTFTASGGTNVTYGAASPATATSPIGAGLSQSFSFSASTASGPAGTPIGIATVTFRAADSGGGKIINSPQTGTMQVNVGGAIADNSNKPGVYGAALSAVVGSGASYVGLESAVIGIQGAGGSNAAVTPFASPWLGGDAKILAGTKSAAVTAPGVSMSWRTRLVNTGANGLLDETHGGPGSALQTLNTTIGLISNVVNLSGLETGSPAANSTDPIVFDLTYNTTLLFGHEQGLAQNKSIYMVSPSPGPDDGKSQYINTVVLNSGNVVTSPLDSNFGALSSWNTYAMTKFGTATPSAAQLSSDMGAWGVDTGAHEVWAIVNHTGTFSATAVTTGITVSVTPAVASASVLKGGSITFSATLNNTGLSGLNGGDYTFTASGGPVIYGAASPATATTPIGAGLSQSFSFGASTIPGPAGTPIGIATVGFTAADSGGGKIFNSPQTGIMQLNVGGAIADNSNRPGVYGPPISAVVASGATYAGLESAVVGLQGTGGINAVPFFAPPWFGADAKILAGTKTAAATSTGVSMSWRTLLANTGANGSLDETHGGPGSAFQAANSATGLICNVVNLSGLETGSPSANSTDPFVFDMTYNPFFLFNEQGLAQGKLIDMVSPSPGPDDGKSQYVNTVLLNSGNVVTNSLDPNYGAVSSWTAYALAKFGTMTPTTAQLWSDMGAWGVDINAHEVWAILDHNSTFAVEGVSAPVFIPEPSAITLGGLGLICLLGLRKLSNRR